MFRKILVAVDGNDPASRAVDLAVELVEQVGAQIGILHVVDSSRAFMPDLGISDDTTMVELRRHSVRVLAKACARIPAPLKPLQLIAEGDPAETIIATATEWNADLIVVGNDSRGRLAHFLLGSTADSVVRRASCPVMVVRSNAATGTARSPDAAQSFVAAGAVA
jgi:nucleotide-binding universal stress UspA family protein